MKKANHFAGILSKIKCIIILFLLLFYRGLAQQGPGISPSTTIFPAGVVEGDSVYLASALVHFTSGCKTVSLLISHASDSMILKSCTLYGDAGSPCSIRDTFLLGHQFEPKTYHVAYIASFTHASNSTDTFCVTAQNDPTLHDTAYYSFTVLPPTATHELNSLGEIHLLPNPAGNRLQLSFMEPPYGALTATIFDLSGQHHIHQQLWAIRESEIVVEYLAPGMYFLELMDKEGQTKVFKFVKR